ncbi:cobyrinate a,c-diamide synthase [Acuticoccus sediminis]|uniref:cobyrinate a,c-diamide synthase n=1 Tax=Acuticoccus sediminis TaxID=2184697 RepID=UPI001CFDF3C5|nr:cobyrinate a,c-diamide synthase [Acuticoccus sediminis]
MKFIVAAPQSGSGKTVVTTGLIAALVARGHSVHPAKVGPDYIDTAFLAAAAGRPALNLDLWAMRPTLVAALANHDSLVVEGVMGLFDGPSGGVGSTADVARLLALPIILVVDASRQSQSIAALVHGFATFDKTVKIAGVILTRVGSVKHARMLREALSATEIPCLGTIPRDERLSFPSRHLGLYQAGEYADITSRIDTIGRIIAGTVDIAAIEALDGPPRAAPALPEPLPPPGQRIAIASDQAFSFTYTHILDGWRSKGATLHPFSPLGDEAPDDSADAIVLPGGYPELHAGRLAAGTRWKAGVAGAAARGALVIGECGGYMALGETLVDAEGTPHAMAGLLPITTSFADPHRTLGYRELKHDSGLLPARTLRGHEFHYATVEKEGPPLFEASDADGKSLGAIGTRLGTVCGSFAHVIDQV